MCQKDSLKGFISHQIFSWKTYRKIRSQRKWKTTSSTYNNYKSITKEALLRCWKIIVKMRRAMIYIPNPAPNIETEKPNNEYDLVAPEGPKPETDTGSISSESDLADSPAGQTIRSSYKSPIFDPHNPLEPCPVNGCPLNPKSGVMFCYALF